MRGRLLLGALLIVTGTAATAGAAVIPRGLMVRATIGEAGGQTDQAATSGTWTADARDAGRGDDGQPRFHLNLRIAGGERDRWGFGVRQSELRGLPPGARDGAVAGAQFTLAREAGTFTFAGAFDGGRGSGTFTFAPSGVFTAAMGQLGYRSLPAESLMRLAVLDVTTAFTRDLRDAGQANLLVGDLTRFRIHGVTGAAVRELAALGYPHLAPETLVRLRIHGVTLDEIDALQALGLRGLGADDLVKFRIHGVRPAFIREMRALGFTTAGADDFVKMRIHRVDGAFVREARGDGLTVTTADDAVDLAIHGRRWRRR